MASRLPSRLAKVDSTWLGGMWPQKPDDAISLLISFSSSCSSCSSCSCSFTFFCSPRKYYFSSYYHHSFSLSFFSGDDVKDFDSCAGFHGREMAAHSTEEEGGGRREGGGGREEARWASSHGGHNGSFFENPPQRLAAFPSGMAASIQSSYHHKHSQKHGKNSTIILVIITRRQYVQISVGKRKEMSTKRSHLSGCVSFWLPFFVDRHDRRFSLRNETRKSNQVRNASVPQHQQQHQPQHQQQQQHNSIEKKNQTNQTISKNPNEVTRIQSPGNISHQ